MARGESREHTCAVYCTWNAISRRTQIQKGETYQMGKTSSASKNKWNASRYTQIKIAVNPELAEAFKSLCRSENASVAGELSGFMTARVGGAAALKRPAKDPLASRGGRRKLLNKLIPMVEQIKDAEAEYLSNIPVNLQGSVNYATAEQSVADLEGALETLGGVYG
jgi:hypothetical protein